MAIEEEFLSEISKSVQRVGDSSESFRATASRQNDSIQRIVKDISSLFRQQSMHQSEMSSAIDDLANQATQNNDKTDALIAHLGDSVSTQNAMLGELRGVKGSIDNLTNQLMMIMGGGAGGGGGMGGGLGGGMGGGRGGGLLTMLGSLVALNGLNNLRQQNSSSNSSAQPQQSATNTQNAAILATIRKKESGSPEGNYQSEDPNSSASGAYGFTKATWKDATSAAGIGTEYANAKDAPREIQDQVADKRVTKLLQRPDVNGDVSRIPIIWMSGNNSGQLTPQQQAANPNTTLEKYQKDWMDEYQKQNTIQQQTAAQQPDANQTAASTAGTSDEYKKFLSERAQQGVDANQLNPDFAEKIVRAIKEAETATGERVSITSGYRTGEKQAQLYANYTGQSYNYNNKIYTPDPDAPRTLAAEPGKSAHEIGHAVDISGGKAREWIRTNAGKFGLSDLGDKDPFHFADKSDEIGNGPQQAYDIAKNTYTQVGNVIDGNVAPKYKVPDIGKTQVFGEAPESETLMSGLGMPAGLGPSSEPTPIGMGDMSSYNIMGGIGAVMGGNALGPSGKMGAAGAALNVLGGIGTSMLQPKPDTRASELNQAAAEQTAQSSTPWVNPDAQPPAPQQPQYQQSPRSDNKPYNDNDDKEITPGWTDRVMNFFSKETSGIFPSLR